MKKSNAQFLTLLQSARWETDAWIGCVEHVFERRPGISRIVTADGGVQRVLIARSDASLLVVVIVVVVARFCLVDHGLQEVLTLLSVADHTVAIGTGQALEGALKCKKCQEISTHISQTDRRLIARPDCVADRFGIDTDIRIVDVNAESGLIRPRRVFG